MNPSREEALFALALAKQSEKRAAWLDAECKGDPKKASLNVGAQLGGRTYIFSSR